MGLGNKKVGGGSLGGGKPASGKLGKAPDRIGDRAENQAQKRLARLGARKTPGSGNYVGKPADIEIPEPETILFESKEITGRRVSPLELTKWLRKITREARTSGRRTPGLILTLADVEGAVPKQWGMIPLENLENLILAAGWDALESDA